MKLFFNVTLLLNSLIVFGQNHPNIILIMADDQGWNGTSVQMDPSNEDSNSDFYQTPNIERIAANGMRFSRAYAPAPKCSPTRMSILTGQTTARNQFTNTTSMTSSDEVLAEPSSNTQITSTHTTIAEILQSLDANYTSAHFGKWHIGNNGPTSHGFDDGDGATGNNDGETGVTINDDPKKIFELTTKGINFMQTAISDGKPFYLQLSHYAVHTSIEYTQTSIDKYNALAAGNTHDNTEFAAMTEDLDTGVGLILDFIDENNITDKTYVIYYSDNGAQNNLSSNSPLMGSKTLLFEGGIRVPLFISGPNIAVNSHSNEPVIGYDFFPTFAEWAGALASDLPTDLDGMSLVDLLEGNASTISRTTPLIFHSPHYDQSNSKEPRSAIVDGDDKLLVEYENGDRLQYNLLSDIDESQNNFSDSDENSLEILITLRDYLKEVKAQMPALSETDDDADADNDGLPDEWEFANLLSTQFSGNDDPDGDGVSNAQEYTSDSDPLSSDSEMVTSISSFNRIQIYPVPVSNELIIQFEKTSSRNRIVQIYNMEGQNVMTETVELTRNIIDLIGLQQGLFHYKITEESMVSFGKIIKR